ncbi:jg24663, partial [Pararge aegeria aegeria]
VHRSLNLAAPLANVGAFDLLPQEAPPQRMCAIAFR